MYENDDQNNLNLVNGGVTSNSEGLESDIYQEIEGVLVQNIVFQEIQSKDHLSMAEKQKQIQQNKLSVIKSFIYRKPVRIIRNKLQPGSLKGSIFNLIICAIGSGVLTIPLNFYYSGWILSIIIFMISFILNIVSCMLLVYAAKQQNAYSYMSLAQSTYGKSMTQFVKINFFLNNYFTGIVYLVLVNKLIAKLTQAACPDCPSFMTNTRGKFWAPIFTVLVAYPLSLFRNLSSLRYVSLAGSFFILYLIIVILSFPLYESKINIASNYEQMYQFKIFGIFKTFPSSIFSFMFHNIVLDVYKELKRPTEWRMKKIIGIALLVAFFAYTISGFFGYLTFSNKIDELTSIHNGGIIILADYNKAVQVLICFVLMSITNLICVPMAIKPTKDCLLEIIYPHNKKDSLNAHVLMISILVFSSLLLAVFVTMMSDLVILVGAASCPLICFVFPAMFYLKTFPQTGTVVKWTIRIIFVYFMILFSIFSVLDFFFKWSDQLNN